MQSDIWDIYVLQREDEGEDPQHIVRCGTSRSVWWNLKIKASDWTSLFKIFLFKDRSRRKRVFSWALPLFFHLFHPFTKHPIFFRIMSKTLHWPIFYMTEGSKAGEPGSARCNFTCGCWADAAAHVQSRVAGWGLAANNRAAWLDWASAKSAAGPLEGAERLRPE